MKTYKINIFLGIKVIYKWVGEAYSLDQAIELAYEQFEFDSYAEEENINN